MVLLFRRKIDYVSGGSAESDTKYDAYIIFLPSVSTREWRNLWTRYVSSVERADRIETVRELIEGRDGKKVITELAVERLVQDW